MSKGGGGGRGLRLVIDNLGVCSLLFEWESLLITRYRKSYSFLECIPPYALPTSLIREKEKKNSFPLPPQKEHIQMNKKVG